MDGRASETQEFTKTEKNVDGGRVMKRKRTHGKSRWIKSFLRIEMN